MKNRVFFSEAEWVDAAVYEILLDAKKDFSLVLSGGSTPAAVYRALAEWDRDWSKTEVYLADERFVPPVHPEANAKLVRDTLQVPAHFHLWDTDLDTHHEAAKMYDQLLGQRKKPFDVVVLGIGPDGHFASLFPHSPALHEAEKLAVATETEEFAIRERLSMTPAALLSAEKIIVLLKGNAKLPILKELESGNKSVDEFPANMLKQHPHVQILFANI